MGHQFPGQTGSPGNHPYSDATNKPSPITQMDSKSSHAGPPWNEEKPQPPSSFVGCVGGAVQLADAVISVRVGRCDSLPRPLSTQAAAVSSDGFSMLARSRWSGVASRWEQSRWLKRDHLVAAGGGRFLIWRWVQDNSGGTCSAGSTIRPSASPGYRHIGRWESVMARPWS